MIERDLIEAYYYAIEQKEPTSVMDVGLFMQKIGMISRDFADYFIPDNVPLYGLDFEGKEYFPLYEKFYDKIFDFNEPDKVDITPELALFVNIKEFRGKYEPSRLYGWLKEHCDYLFTEYISEEQLDFLKKFGKTNPITIEGNGFVTVDMRD